MSRKHTEPSPSKNRHCQYITYNIRTGHSRESFFLLPITNDPLTDFPFRSKPSVFTKFAFTGSVSSTVDRFRFNEVEPILDRCALGAIQSDWNLGRCGSTGFDEVDPCERDEDAPELVVLVLIRRGLGVDCEDWVCDEEGVNAGT